MQKLLSIFVYLILLIFLESAAEVTGVPASAPAELPEEPNYVAITFDDGPRRGTTARLVSRFRPATPVIACLLDERVQRHMALSWGRVTWDSSTTSKKSLGK